MTHDTRTRGIAVEGSDPKRAQRTLQEWADEVKREQLQEAVERLEAQGHLSEEQRRVLEDMSTSIVDELLASVEAELAADGPAGRQRVRAILTIFDCGDTCRS